MATLRQYPHVNRIRSFYQKANDLTRHRGELWYQREHEYALWLALRTG